MDMSLQPRIANQDMKGTAMVGAHYHHSKDVLHQRRKGKNSLLIMKDLSKDVVNFCLQDNSKAGVALIKVVNEK